MKIVLKPLTPAKTGAPGYTHCRYCNQYHSSGLVTQDMCIACQKRNDQEALDAVFGEGFSSIHEKLDIILGIIRPAKPAAKKSK